MLVFGEQRQADPCEPEAEPDLQSGSQASRGHNSEILSQNNTNNPSKNKNHTYTFMKKKIEVIIWQAL